MRPGGPPSTITDEPPCAGRPHLVPLPESPDFEETTMRVLFTAVMQPSHFYPLVPLAWALRSAGHEVRVAHPPSLAPHVRQSGLISTVVGEDLSIDAALRGKAQDSESSWTRSGGGPESADHGAARPDQEEHSKHKKIAFSLFSAAAELMAPDLLAFCREWKPDLIVFDWQSFGGHLVAQVLGIPSVRHQAPGPDFAAGVEGWSALQADCLRELYGRYGVGRVAPDSAPTVDPCPPVLQYDSFGAGSRMPMRYVPYNGNAEVHEWMARPEPGRRRVALTVGGTYFWMMGSLDPVRRFLDALAAEALEVIAPVPTGASAALGEVGPGVRIVENLPLELFLPSCDLIVNHGGSGTVSSALAHGLPQVLSPPTAMGEPPFHNAERVIRAGAGLEADVYVDPAEKLRDLVLEGITNPGYRTSARRLAEQIREQPTPAELVGRLEKIARV